MKKNIFMEVINLAKRLGCYHWDVVERREDHSENAEKKSE